MGFEARLDRPVLLRQCNIMNQLGAKLIEQVWVHELVRIGDVKTKHSLAMQGFRKLSLQSIHVRLLHAKNGVGPSQMPFGYDDASLWLGAN